MWGKRKEKEKREVIPRREDGIIKCMKQTVWSLEAIISRLESQEHNRKERMMDMRIERSAGAK